MNKLKPCPFCGGEMKTDVVTFDVEFYEPPYEQWYLEHSDLDAAANEHCPIPTTDTFYATEAEAIEAWNTRSDDYKQAAEYWQRMYEQTFAERTCHWEYQQDVNGWLGYMVCSECDAKILDEWTIDTPNYCPNCGARVTPKNSETTPKVVS